MTEKTQKLKPCPLSDEIRQTIAKHPVFVEVVEECLATDELVKQFQRLYGVSLPRKSSHPLVSMIDEVTGFKESQTWEFLSHFVPFVHRFIWLPLYREGKLGG